MASEHVLTLKGTDLTQESLKEQGVILVDFWATWCAPCRMVAPIIDQLATEYAGKVKVGKLDIDQEADAAMVYGVNSIPTMVVFRDGVEVERIVGARNKAFLSGILDKYA